MLAIAKDDVRISDEEEQQQEQKASHRRSNNNCQCVRVHLVGEVSDTRACGAVHDDDVIDIE